MKIIKNLTFAALAATLLFQTSIARADDNRDHRDAIITWTKHVTAFLPGPEIFATIAGTAEGDIGDGIVMGEAFNPRVTLPGGSRTFEADYHFIGSKHSLTVHLRTVQGPDPSGVIRGVITGFVKDGWLKGNVVVGEYTGYACDQGVAGCFDGTFVIKRGSKDGKAQAVAPCPEWNLAADFRVSPDQENPNRDSCGNLNVWHFLESDPNTFPAHNPSTYALLPEFINDAYFILGLEQWQGSVVSLNTKDKLPAVGINNTGSTQFIAGIVWPPWVIRVHPLPDKFAIVGWRSPITGAVTVTGGVNDLDDSCGDGILWSIDHFEGATNTTLVSGSIPEGGFQDFQDGIGGAGLASITVNQGDFLYFLVDPNSNHFCDSTELTVSIRPTVIEVAVDIKPGSFPNSINPKSKGKIPVAILTTDTFDATTVDSLSVQFGPSGAVEAHGKGHIEDADGDGDLDLVLHFNTQDTGIVCGATSASLTGKTVDGQAIKGSDSINTVGCK